MIMFDEVRIHRSISVGICYEFFCITVYDSWPDMRSEPVWQQEITELQQVASDWSCDLNMSATNEVTCFA